MGDGFNSFFVTCTYRLVYLMYTFIKITSSMVVFYSNAASVNSTAKSTRNYRKVPFTTSNDKTKFDVSSKGSAKDRELKICNAAARQNAFKTKNIFMEDSNYEYFGVPKVL